MLLLESFKIYYKQKLSHIYLFLIFIPLLVKYNFIAPVIFYNYKEIQIITKLSRDFIKKIYCNQMPY